MWDKSKNINDCNIWHPKKIAIINNKNLNHRSIIIHRGGVYYVDLGCNIGGEKEKLRPCLVISKNILNAGHTVVVIPLSSKFDKHPSKNRPRYNNEYMLTKVKYTQLDKDSIVSFTDIRSVDKSRIGNKMFDVNEYDLKNMLTNLKFTYGF